MTRRRGAAADRRQQRRIDYLCMARDAWREAPDGLTQRRAARLALAALLDMVNDLFDGRPVAQGWTEPLSGLLDALAELDNGLVAPMLEPLFYGRGKRLSCNRDYRNQALCAAAAELLHRAGDTIDQAAGRVAVALGARVSPAQVTRWRRIAIASTPNKTSAGQAQGVKRFFDAVLGRVPAGDAAANRQAAEDLLRQLAVR